MCEPVRGSGLSGQCCLFYLIVITETLSVSVSPVMSSAGKNLVPFLTRALQVTCSDSLASRPPRMSPAGVQ